MSDNFTMRIENITGEYQIPEPSLVVRFPEPRPSHRAMKATLYRIAAEVEDASEGHG